MHIKLLLIYTPADLAQNWVIEVAKHWLPFPYRAEVGLLDNSVAVSVCSGFKAYAGVLHIKVSKEMNNKVLILEKQFIKKKKIRKKLTQTIYGHR